MPAVARISLAPVKGLGLVHPDRVEVTAAGVESDRRFHLVDETGRLVNGKLKGELLAVRPAWTEETGELALVFPDGSVVAGEIELGEPIETSFYGRPVDGCVVIGPWAAACSALAGTPLRLVQPLAPGDAHDRGGSVSLVSDGSLAELAARAGTASVDGRRFRMTFELTGCEAHEEDRWLGARVRVGGALVEVRGPVGRCAITTLDPDTGRRDLDTLRVLEGYRDLREDSAPGFGVVGVVVEPGTVRLGDAVAPA